KAQFDQARRDKLPPARQPKAILSIVRLDADSVVTVPRVRSFRRPRESGQVVAYLLEPDEAPRDSAARDSSARGAAPQGASPGTPARRKEYGSTLVIRDLTNGSEARVADVTSYVVDDSGRYVAYAVSSRTPPSDGVYLRNLATRQTATVMAGAGEYKQ